MSQEAIRRALFDAIQSVAPEAEPQTLPPNADYREELDIDSMDFQSIVVKLQQQLGIQIPDKDVSELSTLERGVAYLEKRVAE